MQKTILITGSTDGIGLETAKLLSALGHRVLLHGRNAEKLVDAKRAVSAASQGGDVKSYVFDLSRLADVAAFAETVTKEHAHLDVLINNAGVYRAPEAITQDGLDIRFAVNTLAPYLLTKRLLPLFDADGRVVNLSSAAQAPVDPDALAGRIRLSDGAAYAQSKLAITMWSRMMADELAQGGPAVIAVNPGSLLGSKMVKEAFGVAGGDVRIGAEILVRAALGDEFAKASGKYFDNDAGGFGSPHPDALNQQTSKFVCAIIEDMMDRFEVGE